MKHKAKLFRAENDIVDFDLNIWMCLFLENVWNEKGSLMMDRDFQFRSFDLKRSFESKTFQVVVTMKR